MQENRSILHGVERLIPLLFGDCDLSAYLPHAEDCIHEEQGVPGSRAFSYVRLNVYDDFFPNHLSATLAGRQLFVCFNNQGKRVFEVAPEFGKGCPVYLRQESLRRRRHTISRAFR